MAMNPELSRARSDTEVAQFGFPECFRPVLGLYDLRTRTEKGRTVMRYTKPELQDAGQASKQIQFKIQEPTDDGVQDSRNSPLSVALEAE